jgi:antitoxin VapB
MVRTAIIHNGDIQIVRLAKDVALPDHVRKVVVVRDGARRIIVPADARWDDFFDAPGVNLADRDQSEPPDRESL